MSRSAAAWLALAVLLGLTLVTWLLVQEALPAWALALVALIKIAVIGLVFLELGRSWWVWGALYAVLVTVVLGGAALLLT